MTRNILPIDEEAEKETYRCCGKHEAYLIGFNRWHRDKNWWSRWFDLLCIDCLRSVRSTLIRLLAFGQ